MLSRTKFVALASALSSLFVVASAWPINEGATCQQDAWDGDALISIRDKNCGWRGNDYMLWNSESLPYSGSASGSQSNEFYIRLPRSRPYEAFYAGEMSNNYAVFDLNCNFAKVVYLNIFQDISGGDVSPYIVDNCQRGYHPTRF
ncbi:CSEP0276 putative effector protein [Blumeria hordei DH14]|uniref:CSEP0276 putative effector protein n=1 Tax=Blumeria graminis f. sp. hordei (strain DH14) TaxID=546991 RepID=N1J5K5_BLUG1|nr:CSEP0276 putative effector protein [Blumeria hordei DH14]